MLSVSTLYSHWIFQLWLQYLAEASLVSDRQLVAPHHEANSLERSVGHLLAFWATSDAATEVLDADGYCIPTFWIKGLQTPLHIYVSASTGLQSVYIYIYVILKSNGDSHDYSLVMRSFLGHQIWTHIYI